MPDKREAVSIPPLLPRIEHLSIHTLFIIGSGRNPFKSHPGQDLNTTRLLPFVSAFSDKDLPLTLSISALNVLCYPVYLPR